MEHPLPLDESQKLCAKCQKQFVCEIQLGKSSCWCFDRPRVCAIDVGDDAGCLCPDCLDQKIASLQNEALNTHARRC